MQEGQKGAVPAGLPGLLPIEAMVGMNRMVLSAILDFNEQLCARMSAASGEWASFITKLLAEDFDLSRRFATCHGPDEVAAAYRSFLHTAFEQYQAELTYMLRLGQVLAGKR